MEKHKPWYTAVGNIKFYSYIGTSWHFPKKLNTTLTNDLAGPLLGISPKDMIIYNWGKKKYTEMFIVALFTMVPN